MEEPSRKGRLFAYAAFALHRRFGSMLVFLDFESSSLGKRSYPIEVAWVFANGRLESHLTLPAPTGRTGIRKPKRPTESIGEHCC